MHFSDGRIYEGNWKNDQRSGHGLLKWADGSFFEGAFANGLRHGYGVMVWLAGREYRSYFGGQLCQEASSDITNDPRCLRYEGAWNKDMKEGFGRESDAQKVIVEGIFRLD